jgi:hypothetical protein
MFIPSMGSGFVMKDVRSIRTAYFLLFFFVQGAVWWCCFLCDSLLFLRLFVLDLASSTVCQVLLKDSMGKDRSSNAANKERSHHRDILNRVRPAHYLKHAD